MAHSTSVRHRVKNIVTSALANRGSGMGVNCLLPFLKDVVVKTHLNSLKGQTAAVDASCWIHRALAVSIRDHGDNRRVLQLCESYLGVLERHGIKPFVVFDGIPLPGKEPERAKRARKREENSKKAEDCRRNGNHAEANKLLAAAAEMDHETVVKFMKLCQTKNIQFIVSAYEADAQIAYMVKNNFADFAISEDSDLLAYGCPRVLYKLQLSGLGDMIEFQKALDSTSLDESGFVDMCVVAGCDYVKNVPGIGIKKAKEIVQKSKFLQHLQNLSKAPADYSAKFEIAKAIFQHQTVINPGTFAAVPFKEWEMYNVSQKGMLQHYCGCILPLQVSVKVATGSVDPKKAFDPQEMPQVAYTNHGTVEAERHTGNKEGEDGLIGPPLQIKITSVGNSVIPWRVPSFPVLTLEFRKVHYVVNGKECLGLVDKTCTVTPGERLKCSSHCLIIIGAQEYTVLWENEHLPHTVTTSTSNSSNVGGEEPGEPEDPDGDHEPIDQDDFIHTLPFKVLGTCHSSARQAALEKAYECLYDYNRPVFVKIQPEPENTDDSNAIAVYIMSELDDEYKLVGYIARELTHYVHPVLGTTGFETSVKHIIFRTTFSLIGFYLTMNISRQGLWPKMVVNASKKVK